MLKETQRLFKVGNFVLDPEEGLQRNGTKVPLTPKILKTLVVLVENHGRLVTKEELMQAVWPDTFVEEGNLTFNIHSLRKALGDASYIETVPRRGYRLAAAVQEVTPASDIPVIEPDTVTP